MSTKEIISQDDVVHNVEQRLETLHEGSAYLHAGCPFRDSPAECSTGCSIERDTGLDCSEYAFLSLEQAAREEDASVRMLAGFYAGRLSGAEELGTPYQDTPIVVKEVVGCKKPRYWLTWWEASETFLDFIQNFARGLRR